VNRCRSFWVVLNMGVRLLVRPHTENGNALDCIGNCWIRLTYDVPVVFGERWIALDFDRDQRLIR
jgi:hypothetical protein